MNRLEIIEFFDECAPNWDAEMIKDDEIIEEILKKAGVRPEVNVLDVACGTGVLIPYYLSRGAGSVTGIDISPAMSEIAERKFSPDRVSIICGDVEEYDPDRRFDCVVLYNAFPHFPEPVRLIRKLAELTAPGGTVTVAHGMSRERINRHHASVMHVSNELMEAEQLAEIFRGCGLEVREAISDEKMYLVSGSTQSSGITGKNP